MQCPHCVIHFHENWDEQYFVRRSQLIGWKYRTAICPGCKKYVFEICREDQEYTRVFPTGASRGPIPLEVPPHVSQDYQEACQVLPLSAKASAALSRRCLQTILRDHGYRARDLASEIDLLINEVDARKGIPESLRQTIDGIRNFGNFSAHPITDVTTLQIIAVEPHEAEWCLEIIEEMFQHFYVRPAQANARKAALDAKLKAAGKPPSK